VTAGFVRGLDLHLDVGKGRGRGRALEAALREAVRSGRLAPGTRLPGSRSLAVDLGLSRGTVVQVFGQLVAEGWLVGVAGSSTVVGPVSAGSLLSEPEGRPAPTVTGPVAVHGAGVAVGRGCCTGSSAGCSHTDICTGTSTAASITFVPQRCGRSTSANSEFGLTNGPHISAFRRLFSTKRHPTRWGVTLCIHGGAWQSMITATQRWVGLRGDPRCSGPRLQPPTHLRTRTGQGF
jgi:hypothetical protein